ncbi:SMI1/KNR4 family protein [Pendulispora brunnea]|uniref:SMI1/KNR4 family protein n=1 Tax=Pendulispora brunnea TaxID=2905690 RepID=A0ABZ2K882_9BACT
MPLERSLLNDLRYRVAVENAERARMLAVPIPAVADADTIATAERLLGFAIHPDLVELYTKVANGGFGPEYFLLGVGEAGHRADTNRSAEAEYQAFRAKDPEQPSSFWPARVLPIHHWGCAIYTCIDCDSDEGTLYRFDPNGVDDDWSTAWLLEGRTLAHWLRGWLDDDDLFECDQPFWPRAKERGLR